MIEKKSLKLVEKNVAKSSLKKSFRVTESMKRQKEKKDKCCWFMKTKYDFEMISLSIFKTINQEIEKCWIVKQRKKYSLKNYPFPTILNKIESFPWF